MTEQIRVGLAGQHVTHGAGVRTYIDELGNIEVIPQTQSSFEAPPLWDSNSITELGGMGVELGEAPYVIDPPINTRGEEELLHDQIHGAVPQLVRVPHTVNPDNPGIPNLGPEHEQPFFTSASQIVHHVDSDEQGWGMEGRIGDRFPVVTDPNPYYNIHIWRRNGALNFSSEGIPFGSVTNGGVQALETNRRNRSTTHERLVDNPSAPTFSDTIPVEGQAGPLDLLGAYDEAIY